jgi:hypothetical protein
LEPPQVIDRIASLWPGTLVRLPGPGAPADASGFEGQYVSLGRAPVRLTIHGTVRATAESRLVDMVLTAAPAPAGLRTASAVAMAFAIGALLAGALDLRQAIVLCLAYLGLVGSIQWVIAGVTIDRVSRELKRGLVPVPERVGR